MDKQYAKKFLKKYLTVTGGPAAVDALDDENKAAKAKEFVKKYFTVVGGPKAIDAAAEPEGKYLTMTLPENSLGTQISINKQGEPVGTNIQYRVNNGDWTNWNFETSQPISANANDVIQWKGDNPDGLSKDFNNYIYFNIPSEVNLSGNVMSLIDGVGKTKVIPCSFCFIGLFTGTKIKTVTKDFLPATELAEGCYVGMFFQCTSLTTAPALPATELAEGCYMAMFVGCTSLTTAPALPATTLAGSCYGMMFVGCTSLTTAPELSATTLTNNCYNGMFQGCSNLNKVTCLATDITATDCTTNWLSNVASTGTFNKAAGVNWSTGVNGIPEGWTVIEPPKYLTMTLPEGSPTTQISINRNSSDFNRNIQYRVNNGNWTNWDFTSSQAISANANDVIQWKGVNPDGLSTDSYNYIYFQIPNEVNLSGNVMSLIDGVGDTKVIPCNYCLYGLFRGTKIKTVSEDLLPATTLAPYCYSYMFEGCTKLVSAPELPATTLVPYCYSSMFRGCTSLVTAPALEATTLVNGCYVSMFYGCTFLENAPALPATTLAYICYSNMFGGCTSLVNAPALSTTKLAPYCYKSMFEGCTSLVNAPELPATTLTSYCYQNMFNGCSKLVTAPALNATTLADSCYYGMFEKCTSLVDAPALNTTTLKDSCYKYMFEKCTSLVDAPDLLATKLAPYCYQGMFNGCSKLQNVTCLATDISATYYTSNWLSGVASEGTFNKAAGVEWSTGVSGIPVGWTVIEPGQPTGPTGPVGDTTATGDTSSHVGDTTATGDTSSHVGDTTATGDTSSR